MVSTEKLMFGELKSLYEKHVTGTCKEIGERYRGLQEIEEQLFVGFISYILSYAGYYDLTLYKELIDDDEGFGIKTTENDFLMWTDYVNNFAGVKEEEQALEPLRRCNSRFS